MHLRSFLASIPDALKPYAAFAIGALILLFIVLFHGGGLHGVLEFYNRRSRKLRVGRPRLAPALLLFAISVFFMLSLHIVEILLWSFPLTKLGLVTQASDAIYYCANAYTTLGYGNVDLGPHWRFISPIIGISGLFTFAWSTSTLVSLVSAHGKLINRIASLREREFNLRSGLRKTELKAMKSRAPHSEIENLRRAEREEESLLEQAPQTEKDSGESC